MVSPYFLWAVSVGFAPKPTRWSFGGFLCWGVRCFFTVLLMFFRGGCIWPRPYSSWVDILRWLFAYVSIMNLCSLVLDRYVAVVKPLKYVNFMTTRRITKLIFFSWVIPIFGLSLFVFLSWCMHQTGFSSATVVPQSKFTEVWSSAAVVSQRKSTELCSSAAYRYVKLGGAIWSWLVIFSAPGKRTL